MDIRKLSHNQLDDLIAKAERRKHELAQERTVRVREKIEAMLEAEGLTIEEVFGSARRGRGGSRTKGTTVKPKYRNPANPAQTWAGRGKRPRWFNDALAAGKKEKDLLIA